MVNLSLDDYRLLVFQFAHRMRVGKPASVEVDDLVQAGMVGLLEAGKRFEPSHGASFAGYASVRIQGAMIDELRSYDWMSRRERRFRREVDKAVCRLQHHHFRSPCDTEIANELGVTPTAFKKKAGTEGGPISLNDIMSGDTSWPADLESIELRALEISTADMSTEPSAVLQQHQMYESLTSAIASLPERQQAVLEMYYTQDLNLKEIGVKLGVSESRVSQLISKSIQQLRNSLGNWRNDAGPIASAQRSGTDIKPSSC